MFVCLLVYYITPSCFSHSLFVIRTSFLLEGLGSLYSSSRCREKFCVVSNPDIPSHLIRVVSTSYSCLFFTYYFLLRCYPYHSLLLTSLLFSLFSFLVMRYGMDRYIDLRSRICVNRLLGLSYLRTITLFNVTLYFIPFNTMNLRSFCFACVQRKISSTSATW